MFYLCALAGMIASTLITFCDTSHIRYSGDALTLFWIVQNGTTRPTHYHVLHDEIGFSADDMQELVHSLSFAYQRSTTALSVGKVSLCLPQSVSFSVLQYISLQYAMPTWRPPRCQFMKFDDLLDCSVTSAGSVQVPELPRLHKHVANSMFFC
ncbi:Argonaute family protein [Quillaja saponaria]|uniref:Argonaute family protein n=1 Tax=Quillaja saponaria TaxID=32244 RepID=A0AAD7QJ49_QUISA|nr:Argonaute family protein [Quillaja saponaria]